MIRCVSDDRKAIIFIDGDNFHHFPFDQLTASGDGEELQLALMALIQARPGWEEAFEKRLVVQAFCPTCGDYEFDFTGTALQCGACGDSYPGDFAGGLLVPSFLAGHSPAYVEGEDDETGEHPEQQKPGQGEVLGLPE